jgi:hypothetical protein
MVKKVFEEKQLLPFFVRSLTVENVDSIGFVVGKCLQCSTGKS